MSSVAFKLLRFSRRENVNIGDSLFKLRLDRSASLIKLSSPSLNELRCRKAEAFTLDVWSGEAGYGFGSDDTVEAVTSIVTVVGVLKLPSWVR